MFAAALSWIKYHMGYVYLWTGNSFGENVTNFLSRHVRTGLCLCAEIERPAKRFGAKGVRGSRFKEKQKSSCPVRVCCKRSGLQRN